jgi:predicted component of type VI protein secretion system
VAQDSSAPRVWITEAGSPEPRSQPLPEGTTTFGRGDHCEVTLDDDAVSWDHLRIEATGPSLMATDLDSSNGTILNGEALARPRRLRDRDVLQLGRFRLEVALPPQRRHDRTAAAPRGQVALTQEERETARALVAPYREAGVRAGRPATRAEVAADLHISERTVQRRLDALAQKLGVPGDAGRERPRLIAEQVLERGLDR